MDIQERIEKNISQVIREELGDSIHPEKLNSIIKNITEKLTFCLTPDELVLLRIKMDEKTQRELAVLSVIGQDSVGIVAEVTKVLAESRANIEGMNQAIVSGYFALILTIDISGMTVSLDELQSMMDKIAEKKNLRIFIQHENIFKSMNRI
ncbi:MAG TPA: ACT domain-containing protein [Spirochaetota bacterium]|nr:ACT domain-containing protein [Spirochaetota bacterium]HPD77030.1 ACT domain-containing protein [Spirochaetota bacterium]HPP94651.1 ACT domain-containing protein [Spirochaetota bacterium]HRS62775.1 ACT domain-containing protein [Spirochaetota bacterium]HRU64746.1 ACT domain-containing protein [Spirochaetota bacterium]